MDYGRNESMRHPLASWLAKRAIKHRDFAARLSCSPQLLSDVFAGRCHFGRENALAVVSLTGGEVTLADLMTWQPASDESAGADGEDHEGAPSVGAAT